MDSMLEQVRVCEGVLAEEKQQHANTRQEVARLGQELEMAREDLVKERTRHREDVEVPLDFTGPLGLSLVGFVGVSGTTGHHNVPSCPCFRA